MTNLIKFRGAWADEFTLSHNDNNQYLVSIKNNKDTCSFILDKQQAMHLAQTLIKTNIEDGI